MDLKIKRIAGGILLIISIITFIAMTQKFYVPFFSIPFVLLVCIVLGVVLLLDKRVTLP